MLSSKWAFSAFRWWKPNGTVVRSFVLLENCGSEELLDELWTDNEGGVHEPNQLNYGDTYAALLRQVIKQSKSLSKGKAVHSHIVANGYDQERLLGNLLIEMYSKLGHAADARKAFDKILDRNEFSWTVMIAAYARNGHPEEAIALYRQMQLEGFVPDRFTLSVVLGACSTLLDLAEGRSIHAHILANELESDIFLETALVNMYGKCNFLQEARDVFDEMPDRNVVSWNAMFAAYAQHGHGKEALELFRQMLLEGMKPERSTFISILDACASLLDVSEGRLIHAHIVGSGLQSDVVLETALVNMYGKFGSLDDARTVFDGIVKKDVVSWNVLIAANAQYGYGREAIELFQKMELDGMKPNKLTFISVLDACASQGTLSEGKMLHQCVAESGLESDVVVSNTLISVYGKCWSLDEARDVFEKLQQKDLVSWNAMIAAYAQWGHGKDALELFWNMEMEGMMPNRITFVSSLDACGSIPALSAGRVIHASMSSAGFESDTVVGNALIHMYGKSGSLQDALSFFEGMHQRNVVSWNAVIGTCARHGCHREALQYLRTMDLDGIKPDRVTFISALDACTSQEAFREGKVIHARVVESGLDGDEIVGNTLVNMLGKCGSLADARSVFEKVSHKTVISWNAMIASCCQNGEFKEALKLHRRMGAEGIKPDKVTFAMLLDACASLAAIAEGKAIHEWIVASGSKTDVLTGNSLISMYGKCGSLENTRSMFDKMPGRNLVSYNAMISVYIQRGYAEEALQVFEKMDLEGVRPDAVTFVSILDACADLAALARAKWVHERAIACGYEADDILGNSLINVYGKCGSLADAGNVFNSMTKRDAISWNGLIANYAQHGYGEKALNLFRRMQQDGLTPDDISFVHVVSACGHAGFVREAICYFASMKSDYGIAPAEEHYGSMIDLLGRVGWLADAEELINKMPVRPDVISWMALLGASRIHGDLNRASRAAKHVKGLGARPKIINC